MSSGVCMRLKCQGMQELLHLLEEHKANKSVFLLLSGGTDEATGKSWCPDCVTAEPVIEAALAKAPVDGVFIYCSVGDRQTWKDPQNEFRVHPKLKLTSVPTLMKWNTPERLGDEDCSKAELVTMLFEED